MDLYQRVSKLNKRNHDKLIEYLRQFGPTEQILAYLNSMPVWIEENKNPHLCDEIRLDSHYLMIARDRWLEKPIELMPVSQMMYCACSLEKEVKPAYLRFIVIGQKNSVEFKVIGDRNGLELMKQLNCYCRGFDMHNCQFRTFTYDVSSKGTSYTIDRNAVTVKTSHLLRKPTELVVPAQQISHVQQFYTNDSDGYEEHWLLVRMRDGQIHKFVTANVLNGFKLAMRLRDCIPELKYGF